MKKNINVIQINGFRGILMAIFVVTCLFAGFGVFPGFVAMYSWNYLTSYVFGIPTIGVFQGCLLWGIIVAIYFICRKNKLVVCMKAPQQLSDEEIKNMFADIKKQAQNDPILQAMMKANELEQEKKKEENQESSDTTNI